MCDCSYNNLDNLKQLATTGKVVGETAKYYASQRGGSTAGRSSGAGDESKTGTDAPTCPLDLSNLVIGWDNVVKHTPESAKHAVDSQVATVLQAMGGGLPPGFTMDMVR